MASSLRGLSRLSSRLQPVGVKLNSKGPSLLPNASSFLKSSVNKRVSFLSRLPVELSGLETMLPLHSAIASARLTSGLALDSYAWGLVPQGISMPL